MSAVKIGIIGGSGLYKMEAFTDVEELHLNTPYGCPSDAILVGTLEGMRVAFLARHGRNHKFLPSELPYRANIYALKSLGVEYIISASLANFASVKFVIPIMVPPQLRYKLDSAFVEKAGPSIQT